jgi:hypothetical protein
VDTIEQLKSWRAEREQHSPGRPAVMTGCICRNAGVPDADGLIFVSPLCLRHGRHLPHSAGRTPSPAERREAEAAMALRAEVAIRRKRRS